MQVKKILITSDDGYDSMGVRLLARGLSEHFEVKISGTRDQMSGVGGMFSMKGGEWGEDEIEGVKALWVSGTPVDAVDTAYAYYNERFDLVVSGINWGANVSGSFISSGTISAAWRALAIDLVDRAIAISWDAPPSHWFMQHDGNGSVSDELLLHPGKNAVSVVRKAIEEKMWGVKFLNINVPRKKGKRIKFVKVMPDIKKLYKYPLILDRKNKTFNYPPEFADELETDTQYDSAALREGFITVTPCQESLLDEKVYKKLVDNESEI